MTFASWFDELNTHMIAEHYHAVDRNSSLAIRLYDAAFTVDEAITVLHNHWIEDANRFAEKLLEQVIQGLQYTVWDEYTARTPAPTPSLMDLCFDVSIFYVVNSDSEIVQIITKDKHSE